MASKRLKAEGSWTGRRVDFPAFSDALSKRRAELGNPELPRNSGERRTESKKALLKAIKDAGGNW
jgi:hypothetical protein